MNSTQTQPSSISDLRPKMKLIGTVTGTQLYGAMVDVGVEYDGLVHISQLSTERVNQVSDVVQPGDEVTVWVGQVDEQKGRIGLTMVEPPDVTWDQLESGQSYTGQVVRLEPYGAFVDIGAERPGLLHVGQMSSGYVRHPSDLVTVGDEIEVRINEIDRRRKRIDLTTADFTYEIEEEEDEEPTMTAMEAALQRAQAIKQEEKQQSRQSKAKAPDLTDREAILSQTLDMRTPKESE